MKIVVTCLIYLLVMILHHFFYKRITLLYFILNQGYILLYAMLQHISVIGYYIPSDNPNNHKRQAANTNYRFLLERFLSVTIRVFIMIAIYLLATGEKESIPLLVSIIVFMICLLLSVFYFLKYAIRLLNLSTNFEVLYTPNTNTTERNLEDEYSDLDDE